MAAKQLRQLLLRVRYYAAWHAAGLVVIPNKGHHLAEDLAPEYAEAVSSHPRCDLLGVPLLGPGTQKIEDFRLAFP